MNIIDTWKALIPRHANDGVDAAAWIRNIPQLEALAKTPQDPVYHAEGDVWTHTLMVLDALKQQAYYLESDSDTQDVLFLAALLHDIAKPSCTRLDPNGRLTSAGHSRRGAIDARILLWRAGLSFELRERVCRIIARHQVPFFMMSHDKLGRRPEFTLHQLSWEGKVGDIHAVAEADMRGRTFHDKAAALADLDLVQLMAEEEGCWRTPQRFPDDHTAFQYFRSEGTISPQTPFFQPSGSKVIVLSGLPAAGKNTWAEKNCPDLAVISFDDAREELGLEHGTRSGAAVHLAIERARALLRKEEPFLWNATHLSPLMRKKTLDLLFAYRAEVDIVYLEAPEAVLHSRNQKRNNRITPATMNTLLLRWEPPLPWEAHRVHYHPSETLKMR